MSFVWNSRRWYLDFCHTGSNTNSNGFELFPKSILDVWPNSGSDMVQHVSWFAKADYPILDFFERYDIRSSPKVVGDNIDYDRSYVGIRLRALRDAGLLVQHENGLYELSDLGREFLAGGLSREEVEALDPDSE